MVSLVEVNLAAVLVAAALYWLLGALWYSPVLFAERWVAAVGFSDEEMAAAEPAPGMVMTAVGDLVAAYVLATVLVYAGAATALEGLWLGALLGLGFVATTNLTDVGFEGDPWELYAINTGYHVVGFTIMGTLLAAWPF